MERAREAAEGRKTSALAQPRSRTVQPIPALASPARIPKKIPDRTAPHPRRRSFPTPQGHYHPVRAPQTPNRPPRSPSLGCAVAICRQTHPNPPTMDSCDPRAPPTSSRSVGTGRVRSRQLYLYVDTHIYARGCFACLC
jgi:hypothetical protein